MARPPRSALRAVVAALALSVAMCVAAPAFAAPSEPVIGLAELRAELAASPSGTLTGHFKTVIRGARIENVPVEVLAVTGGPTDDLDPTAALVLFEARGPVIERIGGVAAGMSGSPVYVNVRGTDRLVGALAFGETFTLNGAALATPIEAMSAIETMGSRATLPLASPVMASSGLKDRVVVTRDAGEARLVAATGGIAVKRLAPLYIGGIDPASAPYRAFAARADANGFDVVPLAAELGTGNERFMTAFAPGAAVAALATRGDLWVGGVGTVTYTSGANVLAFGHPFTGEGATSLYLHNAWVDGTWPSLAVPHKLGTPGALRGTIVQDRNAGIMGVTSATPDEVVVRSFARRTDTGVTDVSRVAIPSTIANSTSVFWQGLTAFTAVVAPLEVYDTAIAAGSAQTTTTVTVTDGEKTYDIVRTNVFDSQMSVPGLCPNDVALIVDSVTRFATERGEPVRVTSVELTSAISATRTAGRIVDVTVPGGLRTGDNLVRIGIRQAGVPATRSVDVTLTIPEGTSLGGTISVRGTSSDGGLSPDDSSDPGSDGEPTEPETLEQLVRVLRQVPANDGIAVTYAAIPGGGYGEPATPSGSDKPIETTASVGFVVTGQVEKRATELSVSTFPARPVAGQAAFLSGQVAGASKGDIEVWARSYGESVERLVATTTVTGAGEPGSFDLALPPLTSTTRLRIAYLGSSDSLPASTSLTLKVAARVSLSGDTSPRRGAPVTLAARVTPRSFGGSVVFERFERGAWRRIATVSAPTGVARVRFTPQSTTRVRARTVGSPSNAAGTSATLIIRPR